MSTTRIVLGIAVTILALAILPMHARAEEEAPETAEPAAAEAPTAEAPTAETPALPSAKELAIKLRPLTKAQIEGEVETWLKRLQEKASELSKVDLELLGGDAGREDELLRKQIALGSDRDKLIQLFEVVLGVYEAKGGDAAEHRKYVDSVRGGTLLEDFDFKKPSAVYTKLKAWVTSPEGGIKWATNIALFIVVMIVFRILAGVLGGITRRATGKLKRTSELLKDFFVNTVRKITFFIGLVIAISFLGVNIGPFLAAIGALGFIIGFALQGTLSNFASGIMILLYRPYDIGDFVDVAGVVGKVDAMSLVSTTIKTPDNQLVIVPNNSIWGGVITNVTGSPTRRVDMVFGIGYGDDIAKAKGILEDILKGHDKILDTPAYVVNVHELADSSVNFVVRPWVKTSDYWDVYWDVTRAVKERFDAEGVSIPFPQRDVHMHQVAAAE
jgi:small conductance mechanosensitive channel